MSDLISRQAAIDALTENKEMINAVLDSLTLDYNTRRNQEQRRGQINEDIETINDLPSAQPEIIRCKDCKWYEIWQLKSDYTDDKRYKPSVCVIGRYAVHRSEDWFCADAERRTDESD